MLVFIMILTAGCAGLTLPEPDPKGVLAVNCDSKNEEGICLKKKNITVCQPVCVDENKKSAWVVTENGQKYCDLEVAVLYEYHCVEAKTKKKYGPITPNEFLEIEHHFSLYSDKEVFDFIADHEYECRKGLCNDNQYESLEFLQKWLRNPIGE